MIKGKFSAVLSLIAQAGAVLFWLYVAGSALSHGKEDSTATIMLASFALVMAGATAYCIYRQGKWRFEDQQFTRWLILNAQKIQTNDNAYYRGHRITTQTVLVRHHIVFSALILSFRYQTRWIIRDKEPRFWHSLAASLYTFCYGWWGFPFGLFWTPVALFKNAMGMTVVNVAQLLQPASAPASSRMDKVKGNIASDFKSGLFIDEKPAGILPQPPVGKS
jgi:hypothetical protein